MFDGDDDKLEALWKKEYSLKEFLEPKHFKSYDVLKAKLDKVLGFDGESPIAKTKAEDAKLKTYDDDVQEIMSKKTPALDEDDDLNYFTSLAN